jgi:hypothetical protein
MMRLSSYLSLNLSQKERAEPVPRPWGVLTALTFLISLYILTRVQEDKGSYLNYSYLT